MTGDGAGSTGQTLASETDLDWPGELRNSLIGGNHIVAKRHISEGEIICEEFPLVVSPASPYFSLSREGENVIPDENLSIYICVNCCKKVTEIDRCAQCQWPVCQNGVCEKVNNSNWSKLKCIQADGILLLGICDNCPSSNITHNQIRTG